MITPCGVIISMFFSDGRSRERRRRFAVASRGVCEGLQVFRTRNENWALAEARSQWPADEAQELAESARSSLWTAEVDLSHAAG